MKELTNKQRAAVYLKAAMIIDEGIPTNIFYRVLRDASISLELFKPTEIPHPRPLTGTIPRKRIFTEMFLMLPSKKVRKEIVNTKFDREHAITMFLLARAIALSKN